MLRPNAAGLPTPGAGVDITGRQQISLWVGLGNSNGQWRSGNLTFRLTLYDTGMSWMQFGGTFKLTASDNWNAPNFTRIAMAIPTGTGFHMEELAEYVLEVPNFTNAAKMGDLYLNCLGASPAASAWPVPPGGRGTVYPSPSTAPPAPRVAAVPAARGQLPGPA